MPAKLTIESDRILEPIERISEFLLRLIWPQSKKTSQALQDSPDPCATDENLGECVDGAFPKEVQS
jgi:hypothetical protein